MAIARQMRNPTRSPDPKGQQTPVEADIHWLHAWQQPRIGKQFQETRQHH
jgi:hypothetical protein